MVKNTVTKQSAHHGRQIVAYTPPYTINYRLLSQYILCAPNRITSPLRYELAEKTRLFIKYSPHRCSLLGIHRSTLDLDGRLRLRWRDIMLTKMQSRSLALAAVAIAVGLGSQQALAASQTGHANAAIVQAINLTETTPMNF